MSEASGASSSQPRRFRRLLVANRGEIACRILRTARDLGLGTVAVYSDADAAAPHTRLADQALRIGPPPAAESYLSIPALIDAAARSGADAVHPGYGFLSERAAFAEACAAAGLVFVGPPAAAIRAMGDKGAARRRMAAAGVPCLPGFDQPGASDGALLTAGAELGPPLMVKAAAGGGGRGMRLVNALEELPEALAAARAEALAAFGSEALILERALLDARHVEIQVLADGHGSVVSLGERDCSVQRRHQKVLEEAPSPAVDAGLRARMGDAAIAAARAIDYRGAGTVEFLLAADGAFHFLEMNTRLQVEHAVTEALTGLDLVELQLRVAAGEPLPWSASPGATAPGAAPPPARGHAIEVRLYAEDPVADFLPASGEILAWHVPEAEGLRVDAGIEAGSVVSPFYDPLLAKVIAHGPDRETARRRLVRALEELVCLGPASNRDFLLAVLQAPAFAAGQATTRFIETTFPDGFAVVAPGFGELAAAAVLDLLAARDHWAGQAVALPEALLGWSSNGRLSSPSILRTGEATVTVEVNAVPGAAGTFAVVGESGEVRVRVLEHRPGRARLEVDGQPLTVASQRREDELLITTPGRQFAVALGAGPVDAPGACAGGDLRAPMHGVVVEIAVAVGEVVAAGQRLLTLEAMKMQQGLRATTPGTVRAIHAAAGDQVAAGALLVAFDTPAPSPAKETS